MTHFTLNGMFAILSLLKVNEMGQRRLYYSKNSLRVRKGAFLFIWIYLFDQINVEHDLPFVVKTLTFHSS